MRRFLRVLLFVLLIPTLYLAWQIWDIDAVGKRDALGLADCAIVLGAAAWHDKPSPVLRERLNHAIKLYQEKRVRALLLTGGYGEGAPFAESEVARDYCHRHGVPLKDILIETKSLTTIENIREAKLVMEQQQWKSALLVSDPWHLKRGLAIAKANDLNAQPSATKTSTFKSFNLRMQFTLKELVLYHQFVFSGK